MTDYSKFYEALRAKPESEWVGILAVALKNASPNVVTAIEEAIEEIDDMNAMERSLRAMAEANPPRLGVSQITFPDDRLCPLTYGMAQSWENGKMVVYNSVCYHTVNGGTCDKSYIHGNWNHLTQRPVKEEADERDS